MPLVPWQLSNSGYATGLDEDLDKTSKALLEADVTTSKARIGQSLSMLVTAFSILCLLVSTGKGMVLLLPPGLHLKRAILDKRENLAMWFSLFSQHCHSY